MRLKRRPFLFPFWWLYRKYHSLTQEKKVTIRREVLLGFFFMSKAWAATYCCCLFPYSATHRGNCRMKMGHFHIDTMQVECSLCISSYYSRHFPLTKSTPAPFHPFFTPTLPEINCEQYTFQILPTNRKKPPYLSGSLPCKVQSKWLSVAFLVWTTFQASVRYRAFNSQ